ncbi:MAG: energy-coupling factor transporter transmembrane protein EcfT [Defluviitaleaceae bacterium]|nr:energy-coupling factor transporter transmembrane protein EcfT [Defluviitaleaceae bacterium]
MPRIAIGQYYPANSPIHSLDPRFKLVCSFTFIIMLFFITSAPGYVVAACFIAVSIKVSTVPLSFILRSLRAIFILLLFTVALNMFFMPGGDLVFRLGFISVYTEGLSRAAMMGSRLILLIFSSSLLTLTTSPIDLTGAIEFVLTPLKKLRVPAAEIAMMMTIALRFIPTLVEEMDKIMKAQKARGADFETGGIVKKARSLIPLLIPLFISAFRRADELAMAMEARCYRPDAPRTRMKIMRLTQRDFAALGIAAAFFGLILATRYF